MSDTTSSIFSIFNKVNTYPECLYGPFSRLSMEISIDQTLQLSIAPILEASKGNKPQKGINSYNNDKNVIAYFTLNFNDIYHIYNNFKTLMSGNYINRNSKDGKDPNSLVLIHFNKDKKPSFFTLEPQANNKLLVKIRMATGVSGSFMLVNETKQDDSGNTYHTGANYSLTHFFNIIKGLNDSGVYDKMSFSAFIKKFRVALYDVTNPKDENGNSGNSNNRSNYNNNNNRSNSNYNNNNNNNYQQRNQPQQPQSQPIPATEDDMSDIASVFGGNDAFGGDDSGNEGGWTF